MADQSENRQMAPEKIDIMRLVSKGVSVFSRTWWLWPLLTALIFGALYFRASRSFRNEYEAYAAFSVSAGNHSSVSSYSTRVSLKQLGETFPYILESGALKKVVMKDLERNNLPVSISASVIENTSLFRISVRGADPELCRKVLDSVIRNYPRVAKYVIGKTELSMLDYSGVPQTPVNSFGRRTIIRNSLIAGTALYILLAALLTVFRRTVDHEDDLKAWTNLRCLAVFPRVQLKRRHDSKTPLLLTDQRSMPQAFREAVNLLRIRVLREMDRNGWKTMMVTSTGEGEGKSSVAANLALSAAEKGFRVVLVDGDLRNPSLLQKFGKTADTGLSDVLKNGIPYNTAIVPYRETSLDILPGIRGERADHVSGFLQKEKMGNLIRALEKTYDYVIVDTPPCGMMQDALVIAGYCDCSLAVVRKDYLARSRIADMLNMLADSRARILGYMINGDTGNVGSYGYGRYGYGSGYGYGRYGNYRKYGYGSQKESD